MSSPRVAPYGSWKSPITADLIVGGTIGLNYLQVHGDDIYWVEGRPLEKGRNVLVRRTKDGTVSDVTPAPYSVGSRVNEYGGTPYAVAGEAVYFVNREDQRVYAQVGSSEPTALTPAGDLRYADFHVDKRLGRLLCVCEDHTNGSSQPSHRIVAIDLADGAVRTLVSGNDFYAYPRLDPTGTWLSWIAWDHPNMPWDGTELWTARVTDDGDIVGAQRVAGGADESIFQPEWSPDGRLYFVSDRTGWWNLYRVDPKAATDEGAANDSAAGAGEGAAVGIADRPEPFRVEPIWQADVEMGMPLWLLGMSSYAFLSEGDLVCGYTSGGMWRLAKVDAASKEVTPLSATLSDIHYVVSSGGKVALIAGTTLTPYAVVTVDPKTGAIERLRESASVDVDPRYFSEPEPIRFPSRSGEAYAFYYPPKNPDFAGPEREKPPLRVISHGGPTGATDGTLKLAIQYWTSRGFAIVDVNYGGSTGYGRAYRERLKGAWGIVDVEDCVAAAEYLVQRGDVDPERLCIAGGSAGGYTTLAALTFTDTFKAGASRYGVSDLEALATDTHKFESRYLDGLIGPYPERADLYRQRSPIHFTERLSSPMIFFQGSEDRVVPPNQSELMVEALRKKGVPVAYLLFEGEGHGFRQGDNIKRALEAELYFYSQIFGFELADPVEPVPIE